MIAASLALLRFL